MADSDSGKLEALFHLLADLPAGPEREAAALLHSGQNGDLARRALALAASDEKARAANEASLQAAAEPRIYGNYRTVRPLGSGGMGAVYLATRADGQFEQTVAVKVIAPHVAGEAFRERFLAERKILAGLNHPNITKLLDGGVTAGGAPYLVMEYVDGEPLDRYCDAHKKGLRERLEMFLKVCAPVAYAHRTLVVHRDLKPSNILVKADGEPMLLDFGTAKLLSGESSVHTIPAFATPRYTSPEQWSHLPVTTSSDVFSLGVILYELLTGAWPFGDPASAQQMMERFARETPMTSPQTVVTEAASQARSANLRSLRNSLGGDLCNVLGKALAQAPEARYESVPALAADIGNWLQGRPVAARPPRVSYRAAKFLRRRWFASLAGAVFVLGLLGATLFSLHEARLARAEALKADRVNQFLNGMLAAATEMNFDPQKFTVGQMLDAAEASLASRKDGPLIEATLGTSLGSSYAALKRPAQARSHLEKAAATFRRLGRPVDEARALMWLGVNAANEGADIGRASNYYHSALELLRPLGADAPAALVFQTKANLAYMESLLQLNPQEASRMIREALELSAHEPTIPKSNVGEAQSTLGAIMLNEGKYTEAEAALRRSVESFARSGSRTAQSANPLYLLVILHARQDHFTAARDFARQYSELVRGFMGADSVMAAEGNLLWARYRADTGETAEAIQQIDAAMPVIRRTYPARSINLWTPAMSAAHILNIAGRFGDAESYAREALAVVDALPSPEVDQRRAGTLWELGLALQGGKRGEAESVFERASVIFGKLGPAWAARAEQLRKKMKEIAAGK